MKKIGLCLIVCFLLSACSKALNQTNSQILVLESQVNQLQDKLSRLEESLDACQKELASLQIENSRIQEELMEMEFLLGHGKKTVKK
ncbi:hypothetical protein SANA_15720 [Gottschalkiaceae bacterium SANA]|nr:hypothetical protein SANA_15720 [Gottschalkiaceae bacterium SANA]